MAIADKARANSWSANGRGRGLTVLETRVVAGSGGGPDKTILNSPRFLWSAGYETLCVYLRPPGDPGFDPLRQKARIWQAPLIELDDRGPWDWRVVNHLLNICRRERVAIWHGHDYKSNALGLLLRRFWPMRLVTTVHGWVHETRRTPLYYWIDRVCLPRYERVICVSPDLLEKSVACGVPRERCALIENGIDTEGQDRPGTPSWPLRHRRRGPSFPREGIRSFDPGRKSIAARRPGCLAPDCR